jgi:hypothetical protein
MTGMMVANSAFTTEVCAGITGGKEYKTEMTTNSNTFVLRFIKTKGISRKIIEDKGAHKMYIIA